MTTMGIACAFTLLGKYSGRFYSVEKTSVKAEVEYTTSEDCFPIPIVVHGLLSVVAKEAFFALLKKFQRVRNTHHPLTSKEGRTPTSIHLRCIRGCWWMKLENPLQDFTI